MDRTILVGLTWRGQEGDGAGLRGHDRQANGVPLVLATATQVAGHVLPAARLPDAIADDGDERAKQDYPIERAHRYIRVRATNAAISRASALATIK